MKKVAFLTSVFALAACGGGGGTGAPAPVVIPQSTSFVRTVDSDTGLGMVDINATRASRYTAAAAIVQSIEDESSIDSALPISRTSIARAPEANSELPNNPTQQEIDDAYDIAYDIFVNSNLATYTNHDILMAMALVFVDEQKVLDLLEYENGDDLDAKIQSLVTELKDSIETAKIKEIVDHTKDVYKNFGEEFTLTLRDAKFYLNSNDSNYYTFAFDDDDNVIGLKEKDETVIPKDKNGVFTKEHVQGYEYTFAYKGTVPSLSANFSGKVDVFFDEKPSNEDLKQALLEKIENENNFNEQTMDAIEALLNDATIFEFKKIKEEEVENAIVSRKADYTEKVRIETGSKDLGLKYSDFGLRYEEAEFTKYDDLIAAYGLNHYVYTEHGGFIGGYEDKKATPNTTMTFTGDAFAGLTRKQSDNDINNSGDIFEPQNKYYKGSAQLTVYQDNNTGPLKQKLVADFSDKGWYKVTVDNMSLDGHDGDFSFANPKNNNINTKWRVDPDNNNGELENKNIKYYGPTTDDPTEVVGFVQYIENHENGGNWTFKADITFGATKDISNPE